jgi:hypothetical protein
VWLAIDSAAATSPAVLTYPEAPRLFVIDPEWMAAERPSLNRLVFLFACLADLEDDGLMIVFAIGWMILTVAYFALLFWIAIVIGDAAWDWMRANGFGWFEDFFRPKGN